MPAGASVQPKKWTNVIDLFDDGEYSAIWGTYDGSSRRRLGVRWNGEADTTGYPNHRGNPLWYIEPDSLAEQILSALLTISIHEKGPSDRQVRDIRTALDECRRP